MAYENRIIYGDEGLGEYYGFDDMVGSLQLQREELQVLTRIGQTGERLRQTGTRAKPTQIETFLYVDDVADAIAFLENDYFPLLDGAAYEVKQAGESFGNFRVLDIQSHPLVAVSNVIGHIGGGTPTYLQRLTWAILATT